MQTIAARTTAPVESGSVFKTIPVALFGSVMGLSGLSAAWHLAHEHYGISSAYSEAIGVVAILAFLAVAAGYAVKIHVAPQAVRSEFAHPIAGSLFGTVLISLLLLPMVLAPWNVGLARVVWALGAVGMAAFAWYMVDRWMSQRQQAAHATPEWIIPVVGMLDIPLAMPALGLHDARPVMLVGLAVGLFFAIPVFTLIFSRLVFEEPLPDALQPTLLILLAPFAVGTSTYVTVTGRVDLFAQAMFALSLFVLAVLIGRLRYLARCCPFRVSWWAVSFPLSAASISGLRIAAAVPGSVTDLLAIALLGLATVVIAALSLQTVVGVLRGELRTLTS